MDVRRLIRAAVEHLEAVRDESRHDEDLPADADQLFVAHREERPTGVDEKGLGVGMAVEAGPVPGSDAYSRMMLTSEPWR